MQIGVCIAAISMHLLAPPIHYSLMIRPTYSLVEIRPAAIEYLCGIQDRTRRTYACAFTENKTILIRNDLCEDAKRVVLQHEEAHLLGWASNHPTN